MKKYVLAIPKGSLEVPTLEILKKVGINVNFSGRGFETVIDDNSLFSRALLMRPQKIPGAMVAEIVDAGITGLDWVAERGMEKSLKVIAELAYGKSTRQVVKIVVFGKRNEIVDAKSTRVSAEYPRLARRVFKKAKIDFSEGTTEADVVSGAYDYGVGVCESGQSLRDNGLKVVKVIMESPVVLAAKEITPELKLFGEILNGTLEAEKRSLIKFDCAEAAKNAILAFLPAIETPTVNRQSNGNYAIETVVAKGSVFNLLMKLKLAGATGILVQDFNILL